MDLEEYKKKYEEWIKACLKEGTEGSFCSKVLNKPQMSSAYNYYLSTGQADLQGLATKEKGGQPNYEASIKAGFNYGMAKALGCRYASRITAFKFGYDKKMADTCYLVFSANNAKLYDENKVSVEE